MADRELGYRGEKFSKKCFQRQLRESKLGDKEVMTLQQLKESALIEIPFKTAQEFILQYEWLGSMGTTKFSYGLYHGGELLAVFCFGVTAGTHALSEPFGEDLKAQGIVLVRGASAPWAHEHTSSYGIGKVLKAVADRGYRFVIAYSDLEAGEIGTVYQATNWQLYGATNPINYLVRPDGKRVDPKLIYKYAKKNGITSAEQKQNFVDEGYTFEKASPKLKYLITIGSKRQKRDTMKRCRVSFYPYPKRQDDMRAVLEEVKQNIKLNS